MSPTEFITMTFSALLALLSYPPPPPYLQILISSWFKIKTITEMLDIATQVINDDMIK